MEDRPPAPKIGGEEEKVPIIDDLGANSYKINLLSLVIPAHNEEDCIVNTINNISEHLDRASINYEILVVNDNSKDNTESILQTLHEKNSRVRYINNYYPNGFGFAVRCGLENFKGGAFAIVMADNSDSPENMIDYYNKIKEGYDCVFGSRFIKGGKVIDYPFYKLTVNRMANLFISVLFGLNFNGTTNAFKMYRREVIEGNKNMLKSYEALYENGQLKFLKDTPNITNAHVIITVIEELSTPKLRQPPSAIAGKGKTLGDIVNPLLEEEDWECLK